MEVVEEEDEEADADSVVERIVVKMLWLPFEGHEASQWHP